MTLKKNLLRIGFDDTDSPLEMCTTYLAYKIVNSIKEEVTFVDYPHLIRFNPNIPWKTRGNGAVALTVTTNNPEKIKRKVKRLVKKYSDVKNGANPGLVFYNQDITPNEIQQFSELALWQLIERKNAKKLAKKFGMDAMFLGNGQGLVGAIGAIGYTFNDHTFELLTYRKKTKFGTKRNIEKLSVKKMQEKTYPLTFNSYDEKKNRVLITPHGPDPVFYGVRGEDPKTIINASKIIKQKENLDGYMTFKTNQGTGAHLKNTIDVNNLRPYTSGIISGTVLNEPKFVNGKHIVFSLDVKGKEVFCAVYRQTKITTIASNLQKGDRIQVGGGIRKASKNHTRVLNVEFIKILNLEKNFVFLNPHCSKCNKRMKSKGKNQGFQCVKCGKKSLKKEIKSVPRKIKQRIYLPSISAHRHLSRPFHRIGKTNRNSLFENNIPWVKIYQN